MITRSEVIGLGVAMPIVGTCFVVLRFFIKQRRTGKLAVDDYLIFLTLVDSLTNCETGCLHYTDSLISYKCAPWEPYVSTVCSFGRKLLCNDANMLSKGATKQGLGGISPVAKTVDGVNTEQDIVLVKTKHVRPLMANLNVDSLR